MMTTFPRGSEWRRWDLHLHTPGTLKNDCFTGDNLANKWEQFYSDISDYINDGSSLTKDIAVIGITDYLSIDNYRKVLSDNRLPNSISLILPNVEMRMQPPANDSPINIHFIFNPAIESNIESRFFARLSFTYGDTVFSATQAELIRLGHELDNSLIDENAYKKGVEQFVPSFDKIKEVFTEDADLRDNTIIFVSNSSTDGVTGAVNHSDYFDSDSRDPQLKAFRQSVYQFVDGLFSATPSDITYFLGKKIKCPPELVISQCGSLKPCIHGCDAHENNKIFEPTQQRYCWIKSDPTFNGLKQIIYEPEERVCISDTKPQLKSSYQVIESITINHNDFQSDPIVFNDKLNCIIGGKSTGKSILLHNLARAISPKQVDEKCEIISFKSKNDKKGNHLTLELAMDTLSVRWLDGDKSTERKIVYIPQSYLNRLADSSEETTEIDNIVERILLEMKDENGNTLMEAKKKLFSKIDTLKSDNTNKLLEIIRRYDQIKQITDQINNLGGRTLVEKELEKLQKQRDELSQALNLNDDDVNSYDEALSNIERQSKIISLIEKEIKKITEITTVVQYNNELNSLSKEIMKEINSIISKIVLEANNTWNIQKAVIINNLESNKYSSVKSRNTSIEFRDKLKDTIESNNAIKELANRIAIESKKIKSIGEFEDQIAEEKNRYNSLVEEVASSYVGIRTDYESFACYINHNTPRENSDLSYDIQIPFKHDDFIAKWIEIYGTRALKSRELVDADSFVDESYSVNLIKSIIEKTLGGDLTPLRGFSSEQALRGILDDWYNIKYVTKMGNDTIAKMSPGKKALVLLKLLIELADSDCPILIDQPEDDLDNRSIYDLLIEFVRTKKVNRQIIAVTHNANIVLGADADLVIVANQDGIDSENKAKRFEYRSGSIENDYPLYTTNGSVDNGVLNRKGIQQHICDILEGGIKAFEKRKSKYHI